MIWFPPQINPALPDDEVHIWRVVLNIPCELDVLAQVLSPDEHDRASRFVFSRDRQHYIVARYALRTILGRYLYIPAAQVEFTYNTNGKPFLATTLGGKTLSFNLSHSGELALVAVARRRAVGVDVERIRELRDYEGVARDTFSPAEYKAIQVLPAPMRLAAFFACWTRKEAYVKAIGGGLSHPMDQFEVSVLPGETCVTLRTPLQCDEATHWTLRTLSPGDGYLGALAVEGGGLQLRTWQYRQCLALMSDRSLS